MSWPSSIEYERRINEAVNARLGGTSSASLILRSFNFQEIADLQAQGEWDSLSRMLAEAARALVAGGADAIAICTNTMHLVAPQVASSIDVPLLHIGDATAEAITAEGVRSVALLGTRYTMEKQFLKERLTDAGIEVLVPSEPQREQLQQMIYGELVQGVFTDASRGTVLAMMRELVEAGARGVVAGCTEIELLVPAELVARELGVPYFATASIHALAIAEFALG